MTGALTDGDRKVLAAVKADNARTIRRLWNRSFEDFLVIGRLLADAKAEIGHGGFGDWVAVNLPFGARTASTLMAVAARYDALNGALKSETVADLPREYSTLSHILKLDAPVIAAKVDAGEITPEMSRADAQRLVRCTQFAAEAPPPPPDDLSAIGEDLRVSLPRLAASGARFRVVVADPARSFQSWSAKGDDRNPNQKYDVMSDAEIGALPVADVCAEDCVLAIWDVDWMPPSSLERIIEAWGFTYKGRAFEWVKYWPGGPTGFGPGYGTRSGSETMLLATRGSPARLAADVPALVFAERDPVHSRKPEEIQNRIERLYGGPYLELFARRIRDGWTCLGNEVETVIPDADDGMNHRSTEAQRPSDAASICPDDAGQTFDPEEVHPDDLPVDDPRSTWFIPPPPGSDRVGEPS
jgi:N6-adenosine-specific RNA methylase IME4